MGESELEYQERFESVLDVEFSELLPNAVASSGLEPAVVSPSPTSRLRSPFITLPPVPRIQGLVEELLY